MNDAIQKYFPREIIISFGDESINAIKERIKDLLGILSVYQARLLIS